MPKQPKNNLGVARLLVAVYAVFALSATARATYQLITKFDQAPIAYSLSALAAVVYVVATISLAQRKLQKLARFTLWFELTGVIVVGALSLFLPQLFAHPTVWSQFGLGYALIPLVLPILGLLWLRKAQA